MRLAARALQAPALLVVLFGLPLAAEALSAGSVRQVGDLRGFELAVSSLDCPTSDGLIDHWDFELDFDPRETWLRLRRSTRDGAGREVEAPRLVLERDIRLADSVARQCRSDGGVLISTYTREPACTRLIEELDRDGGIEASYCIEANGRYGFPGSSYHPDLSLGDGSFLVVGTSRAADDGVGDAANTVGAVRYGIGEGWVEGESAFAGSVTDTVGGVAAATDGVGGVLLVWTLIDAEQSASLWARRLERSGNPIGDAILVEEHQSGWRGGSGVVSTGPGEFVVGWHGPAGPGWLGRSVHFGSAVTTTLPTTSTSTTTLLSYNGPRLDHTVELDSADWIGGSDLATDGEGTWMAIWRAPSILGRARAFVAASWNDGRTWSEPLALPEVTLAWQESMRSRRARTSFAIATDGEGTWIVALMRQPQRWECWVEFVRSTDNGRSWQPSDFEDSAGYGRIVEFWETYDDHRCRGTDIAWAGGAEWIFALSSLADGFGYFNSAQVFIASSDDGGRSWQGSSSWPREDAIDEGSNSAPAIVATPGGATIVAWRTNDLRAMQWSGPLVDSLSPARASHTWIEGLDPYPETWLHPRGLSLAAGSEGEILAAWPARDLDGSSHGWDPDVVVARSDDLGSTWSAPAAVAPYALWDGSFDSAPLIAAGWAGRYLLAWTSYLGDRQYSGGEVLLASSDDAGLSWTHPVAAREVANGSGPVLRGLVGDERGTWALLTSFSAPPEAGATRLVLSMTSSRCGDGILDDNEVCDDGNAIEGDGCDTNCTVTGCGNGILSAGELCDDGNPWPGDACSPRCEPTFCGDGIVRAGAEWCDDGNEVETDRCLSTCELAKCGDGILWQSEEQCDDANQVDGDGCSATCLIEGVCGDADGDGVVTATDARHVLAYSVALLSSCSTYVCDVDANGYVNATDARAILLQAVGLLDEALCAAGHVTVVFQLVTPVSVGALQFDVDYSGAPGEFAGDRGDAECTSMLESTFMTFNNELGQRVLRVAVVNLSGVQGPANLASCTFLSAGAFDPARLRIEVVDASDPSLTPIVPLPVVAMSVFPGRAG